MSVEENVPAEPSTRACPVCDAEALDGSVDDFDAVCAECGYVLRDASDPSPVDLPNPNLHPTDDEPGDTVPWLEYCTICNATEKRLAAAIDVIEGLARQLDVSRETRRDAADQLGEAMAAEFTDGRDTGLTASAALYWATRQAGNHLPVEIVAESAEVDSDDLHATIRDLERELEIERVLATPSDYVSYFEWRFDLDDETVGRIEDLLAAFDDAGTVSGKNPVGVTAAACYAGAAGDLTQHEASEVAGITPETLRKRLREFEEVGALD